LTYILRLVAVASSSGFMIMGHKRRYSPKMTHDHDCRLF